MILILILALTLFSYFYILEKSNRESGKNISKYNLRPVKYKNGRFWNSH